MRNLKVLGMALVAMFAMSAVMASAASADVFKTEDLKSPVTLTGTQATTHVLGIAEGNTSCKKATFNAAEATNGSSAVLAVVPHYTECTSIGVPATVHVNGCTYTLRINAVGTNGTADLVCPAGKEITVTAAVAGTLKCTIHVEPQTGLGTVSYSNTGTGTTKEVDVSISLVNIKYKTTAGTGAGACPATATTAAATLNGSATVTAELPASNTHEGIFVA